MPFDEIKVSSYALAMNTFFSRSAVAAVALFVGASFSYQPGIARDAAPLFPVNVNGKWGLVDAAGEFAIPANYDAVDQRIDGDFNVKMDDDWAIFRPDGSQRIGFGKGKIGEFKGGYATISFGFWTSIINENRKVVLGGDEVSFSHFDGADLFAVNKNGVGGIVSKDCEWLLEPSKKTEKISKPDQTGYFSVGSFEHKHGIMKLDGSWLIEPGEFEDVGEPASGLIPVKQGGKWGFINATREWIIEPIDEKRYRWDSFNTETGLTRVTVDGKQGLMDREGKFAVSPAFDSILGMSLSGAVATKNGKQGFIDLRGNVLVPFKYDWLSWFDDIRLFRARIGKERLFLNDQGQEVFANKFESTGSFFGREWAPASQEGRWGAINSKGEWILQPRYYCVDSCYLRKENRGEPVVVSQVRYSNPRADFISNPREQSWCHAAD